MDRTKFKPVASQNRPVEGAGSHGTEKSNTVRFQPVYSIGSRLIVYTTKQNKHITRSTSGSNITTAWHFDGFNSLSFCSSSHPTQWETVVIRYCLNLYIYGDILSRNSAVSLVHFLKPLILYQIALVLVHTLQHRLREKISRIVK